MPGRYTLSAAILLFGSVAMAGTDGDEDRFVIVPLKGEDFEVVESQDMSPRAFWCGAASYVERRTNRPASTSIFLKSARGPSQTTPGRKAVVFTTDPTGLRVLENAVSIDVRRVGLSLKSYQARGFCRDAFTRATK